jgi:hypothetical protein
MKFSCRRGVIVLITGASFFLAGMSWANATGLKVADYVPLGGKPPAGGTTTSAT